ncbi:MAG: PAS domain-containing protein [Leptospiraceae bacterium]|nr:PAS domain-containing protein [Leptospiraceae bacterium]
MNNSEEWDNWEIIKNIQEAISYKQGEDFFSAIVLKISKTIDAEFTFVGEYNPKHNSVKTISLCANGEIVPNFEYYLKGTPCAGVIDDSICIYPRNVQSLFPEDTLLQEMGIEGYLGVPLYNSSHKILGILVALYKKEIESIKIKQMLLEIFSGRTGAELERIQTARELKSREEQLNSIINNTNAVIYLKNLEGQYLLINNKWASLFHLKKENIIGRTDDELFTPEISENFKVNDREVIKTKNFVYVEEVAPVDGELKTYLSSKFPILDSNGEI